MSAHGRCNISMPANGSVQLLQKAHIATSTAVTNLNANQLQIKIGNFEEGDNIKSQRMKKGIHVGDKI